MTRPLAATIFLIALMLGVAGHNELGAQSPATWITLFDGRNLENWNTAGNANWRIVDGSVQADMGNGYLVSKMTYADFDLNVEFWVNDEANSGVFIRCASAEKIGADTCYEVNIFDKRPDPTYRTGAIVNVAKPMAMIDAGGRWNTFEISARGPRLTVTLNGTRTVDVENSTLARGPFALQYGGGVVRIRKVEIRAD